MSDRMTDIVVCPSGLTGIVRGLKVREERILADRKLAKANAQLDELLQACWVETHEPGPYEIGAGAPDWDKVLQGDRFYALLAIRIATYGPEYAFAVTCAEDRCRARFEWEVDLRQLPTRTLSDASRARFTAGNRFETLLPAAGRRVAFKLMTGADERKLPMLRRNADGQAMSAVLAYRCIDIDGVGQHEKRRFIDDLSMSDADALVEAMNDVDCGVQTTLDVECPECLATQEIELPFSRGFFARKKKPTASDTTSSAT